MAEKISTPGKLPGMPPAKDITPMPGSRAGLPPGSLTTPDFDVQGDQHLDPPANAPAPVNPAEKVKD